MCQSRINPGIKYTSTDTPEIVVEESRVGSSKISRNAIYRRKSSTNQSRIRLGLFLRQKGQLPPACNTRFLQVQSDNVWLTGSGTALSPEATRTKRSQAHKEGELADISARVHKVKMMRKVDEFKNTYLRAPCASCAYFMVYLGGKSLASFTTLQLLEIPLMSMLTANNSSSGDSFFSGSSFSVTCLARTRSAHTRHFLHFATSQAATTTE